MNRLLIIIMLLLSVNCFSQFHVRVECNPRNEGKTNPAWLNNYVISYTEDNWQHKFFINWQATYVGYDDNGKEYLSTYFEILSYQKLDDAVTEAKVFKSLDRVAQFLSTEFQKHLIKDRIYREANKKLCFGCKVKENIECKTVYVY